MTEEGTLRRTDPTRHRPDPGRHRLRVLVDGRVLQDRYHGIGRHTYELLVRIAQRDVELVVVHDPTARSRFDLGALDSHGRVRVEELRVGVVAPAAQRHWPSLIRRVRPDVLLSPYHLAAPWVHPGVPTVTFVHDCIFESFPQARPGGTWFGAAYGAMTRLALARSSAVATISRATRDDLLRHYGVVVPDDAVIPHGVGDQFGAHAPLPAGDEGSVPAQRYVLHVGVHRPHKNHDTLLAAFAGVAAAVPDVRLVLVGQSDDRFPTAVRDMIRTHGLEGRVELRSTAGDAELLALYRNAAAFAFPSLIEGFGLPVLEAMAAGVPTVTSDAAAVLEAASGASLVAGARDVAGWRKALIEVLTRPALATDLAARGRVVATERTWDRSAARTEALLRRVAERAPAA